MTRFTIQNLLAGTLAIAVVLAFVAKEPLSVALASVFCVFSWIGISYLLFLTCSNLVQTVSEAYRERTISILIRRYRWACVDGLIVVWGVIAIAIANFVLENSVANAGRFVMAGLAGGPLIVATLLALRRNDGASQ